MSTNRAFDPAANPYTKFYQKGYGHIFGRPLCFTPNTDPNNRVFQKTMLENNTIIQVSPGMPKFNNKLNDAQKFLDEHKEKADKIRKDTAGNFAEYEKQMGKLNKETQNKLIKNEIDMRNIHFEYTPDLFKEHVQHLINKVTTGIFGFNSFTDLALGASLKENAKTRGFNIWCEKATSISEGIDNSYSSSVLEKFTEGLKQISKEFQYIKGTTYGDSPDQEVQFDSNDPKKSMMATIASNAGTIVTGSKLLLSQFWTDGKFNRNYEISYKFTSPYGDDTSVFLHVLLPFLMILGISLPRQDGPSGMNHPFILQVDCPGWFSCPMGVVTSCSFKKGGDDNLFNRNGLPLVIEGTLSIMDLYSALTMPASYEQAAVNMGTSAYLSNLAGLTLYDVIDPGIKNNLIDYFKDVAKTPFNLFNRAEAGELNLRRYFGIPSNDGSLVSSLF